MLLDVDGIIFRSLSVSAETFCFSKRPAKTDPRTCSQVLKVCVFICMNQFVTKTASVSVRYNLFN